MSPIGDGSLKYIKEGRLSADLLKVAKHAESAMNSQDYLEAIKSYDEILSQRPDLDDVWAYRGIAFSFLDRPEDAWKSLYKAIELCPDDGGNWDALSEFALGCRGSDYFKRYISVYRKYHPEDTDALLEFSRSTMYFLKNLNFASELCKEFLGLKPGDKRGLKLLEKIERKKAGKWW